MENLTLQTLSKEDLLKEFEQHNRVVRHYCDLKQNLDAVKKSKPVPLLGGMLEIDCREMGGIGMVIEDRKELIEVLEFLTNRSYKIMSSAASDIELSFEESRYIGDGHTK